MGKQHEDGISWTDFTWGFAWGCTPIEGSPACGTKDGDRPKCYAWTWAERMGYNENPKDADKFPIWGAHEKRRLFGDKHWGQLTTWNRQWKKAFDAGKVDHPHGRVFIMSMGDWAEGRPEYREQLARLWKLMPTLENLRFLMLTKRPQLIRTLCPFSYASRDIKADLYHDLLPKDPLEMGRLLSSTIARVDHGTTAENQYWLDIRWPFLRDSLIHDQVGWLSIEPQVGKIHLPQDFLDRGKHAWVVVGGQSGFNAIPFDPDWGRYLRDQCREAGVAFHFKQMAGNTKAALQAIPPDLMIREFPHAE
jgi:protein gp37